MSTDAHVVAPAPLLEAPSHWIRDRAWIVGWWLGGRALVLATAAAVHFAGIRGYDLAGARRHVFGLLGGWDGVWYRRIASDGYLLIPGRPSDPAFFPLYPILLRGAHALGLGYQTVGLVISNTTLLGALLAVAALTGALFGPAFARRTTVYAAIFPLGYVFSMAYPESVVLGLIALAGLAALRRHWLLAAACAAGAALARPEGVFVAIPVLVFAWKERNSMSPLQRGLALGAVCAPVAALASYPAYLGSVLHDPLAWGHAEHAWGRSFSPLGFVRTLAHLPHALAANPWLTRDVVSFAIYIVLLAAARRAGAPLAWVAAGTAIVTLPLFSGSFESIGRFGLLALPVFWGLAWIGRDPRVDQAVRAGSLILLVALTATIPFVFP